MVRTTEPLTPCDSNDTRIDYFSPAGIIGNRIPRGRMDMLVKL